MMRVVAALALLVMPLTTAASAQGRGASAAGPVLVVVTDKGTIEIQTFPADAPNTVKHVLALAKQHYYDGLRVHRVEPGFVVQFGDPQSRDITRRPYWGTRGSGAPVGVAELNRVHILGAVAMAHPGDPAAADAQIYILMRDGAAPLDGRYAVFGQVTTGMDVVTQLVVTDIIRRVTVKP